jgi:hypothetical protein
MVIVADAILIASRRPRGLNPPDEPLFGEHPEGIVDRLPRNRTDLAANFLSHIVRRRVRPLSHGTQHGQPLRRNLEAILSQK